MIDTETRPRRSQRASSPSKGDRREQDLLDASGRMLADGSFAQASITDVAKEAGLSRASFYFYFASKQALLATLVDEAVRQFNLRIAATADDQFESPEAAVRASVQAAADLWWEHGVVMSTSVELGTSVTEVYERTVSNFEVVAAPTIELLQRFGTVPESEDAEGAAALVNALMLMSERNFFHLMRGKPTAGERDALTATLQSIWLRAFGLNG